MAKAFGFTLNEKWGKRAFWFWIIGFFVAFMPLYVLGFMGMTRRLSQQIDPQVPPNADGCSGRRSADCLRYSVPADSVLRVYP